MSLSPSSVVKLLIAERLTPVQQWLLDRCCCRANTLFVVFPPAMLGVPSRILLGVVAAFWPIQVDRSTTPPDPAQADRASPPRGCWSLPARTRLAA
jgi:hypothetical protein